MASECRFCTFCVAGFWFGIAVERAQEVIPSPLITPIPLAPRAVAGLTNLRGQMITVVDLRRRLGFEERSAGMLPVNVAALHQTGTVGLLVDEIGEVVEAAANAYQTAPDNLPVESRELVPGVYKLPNRLLHVLDLDKVLDGDGGEVQSGKV